MPVPNHESPLGIDPWVAFADLIEHGWMRLPHHHRVSPRRSRHGGHYGPGS